MSDVAREAKVSWPTAKRHAGSVERLKALAAEPSAARTEASDTRARLLAAAARVVAQRGHAGATLDAIAADAGLSKGAVYWHFEGKRQLLQELVEELRRPSTPARDEQPAHDASQALHGLLGDALGRALHSGETVRLTLELLAASRDAALRELLRDALRARRGEASERVRRLQREELLSAEASARDVALLAEAVIAGLALISRIDPEAVDLATFLPEVSRLLAVGLGKRRGTTYR